MFKKKEKTTEQIVNDALGIEEQAQSEEVKVPEQPLQQEVAFSLVKEDGVYKVVAVKFDMNSAVVLEEFKERSVAIESFKIQVARSGILG